MYNEISLSNLVEETGNTWNYDIDAYKANRAAVKQWHATVNLTKQYKYIGLTRQAAMDGAARVLSAYQIDVPMWVQTSTSSEYLMSASYTLPETAAEASPVYVDGEMWELQVQVNAEAEVYTRESASPSLSTLQPLLSAATNYPELNGRPASSISNRPPQIWDLTQLEVANNG